MLAVTTIMPPSDADAALLADVANGDRRAFQRLHARYFRRIFGFARRSGLSAEAAEEAASDTMLAVWRSASRFEGRSKTATWIFGIAHRQTMRRHRTRMVDRLSVPLEDAMVSDNPNVVSFPADERTDVARALNKLPQDYRALIEMTYIWGLSMQETAETLNCPVGTVKSRMSRARTMLRNALDGE